jgi:hypothetical protein
LQVVRGARNKVHPEQSERVLSWREDLPQRALLDHCPASWSRHRRDHGGL